MFSEIVSLVISKTEWLGGERGMGLRTARLVDARWLEPMTFWMSVAIAGGAVAGPYVLMRSRIGLGLMTVRDNDLAATSIGVDVIIVLMGAIGTLEGPIQAGIASAWAPWRWGRWRSPPTRPEGSPGPGLVTAHRALSRRHGVEDAGVAGAAADVAAEVFLDLAR